MELLAQPSFGVDRYHHTSFESAMKLLQVTLELSLQAIGVQWHAFVVAGIRTVVQGAAVHQSGIFGDKVMPAMARLFIRNGVHIRSFLSIKVVVASHQVNVYRFQFCSVRLRLFPFGQFFKGDVLRWGVDHSLFAFRRNRGVWWIFRSALHSLGHHHYLWRYRCRLGLVSVVSDQDRCTLWIVRRRVANWRWVQSSRSF